MKETASDPGAILLSGIIAAIVLMIGRKRGFFVFPSGGKPWTVPIKLGHVAAVFLIYFGVGFVAIPLFRTILTHFTGSTLGFVTWLHFINSFLIFGALALFVAAVSPDIRNKIWQRDAAHHYAGDLTTAISAWILAFPLVLFCSQLFDWLTVNLFQIQEVPEQLAVNFLKMTFGHPLYVVMTIFTVVVFAPLIEEILFRGCLQSFIRQHLGSKQAIGITSLLFAFFHFSPEQGLGNIPIIASLFILALFLGFIYEKRGSLLAPMALHALFNSISVINLYFLGGFPKGPL